MGRRETNEPRKLGIAQNEQRRSHPLASLSGAIGPPSSRRRTVRGPVAGAPAPMARPARQVDRRRPWPGTTTSAAAARSAGEIGSSLRRSCGVCGWCVSPARIDAQPVGDVGVVVEAEHRVGLGQRRRRARSPYRSARQPTATTAWVPDGALQVGSGEQGVDGVLLGRLDEAAGVHHDGLGVGRVVDQAEAAGLQPPGQLLGVDLVAGAAERHQRDGRGGSHRSRVSRTERTLPEPALSRCQRKVRRAAWSPSPTGPRACPRPTRRPPQGAPHGP